MAFGTNLGHDRLSILSFNVTERHLGTLVLVKFELRIVDVGDLLKRDYSGPFSYGHANQGIVLITDFCPEQPF
jgi:hypothetical protein